MSQIIYTGPLDGVVTPDGVLFRKGVPVEVSPELAASLLTQAFTQASAPAVPEPAPAPVASFVAPPAPAPTPDTSAGQVLYSAPAPQPAPSPIPDASPAPVPNQGATVLAPVSGVTA